MHKLRLFKSQKKRMILVFSCHIDIFRKKSLYKIAIISYLDSSHYSLLWLDIILALMHQSVSPGWRAK